MVSPITFFESLLTSFMQLLYRTSASLSYLWRSCRRFPKLPAGSTEEQELLFLLRNLSLERRVRPTPGWRWWYGRFPAPTPSSWYWIIVESIWVSMKRIFSHIRLQLLPQGKCRCLFGHVEVDVLNQMHLNGWLGYLFHGSSFFWSNWSQLGGMPYCFNLSLDDDNILHHLFP